MADDELYVMADDERVRKVVFASALEIKEFVVIAASLAVFIAILEFHTSTSFLLA